MKNLFVLSLVVGLLAMALPAHAELGLGDSRDVVVAELGPPSGYLKADDYEILYYDRGRVVIKNGAVTALKLVSEAELIRQRQAELLEQERLEARRQEEYLMQAAQGEARRQALLDDPAFIASTPEHQVQIWKEFRRRYPLVDVTAEYTAALDAYGAELRNHQAEQRLQQLENRVAQAENRARQAEARAAQAEQVALERRSNTVYTGGVYYPVVYPVRRVETCATPYVSQRSHTSVGINPMRLDYMNNRRVTSGSSYGYRNSCSPSVSQRSYRSLCAPSSGLSISLRL